MTSTQLSVRQIPAADHLAHLASFPETSFMQLPAWAGVKSEWRAEYLGWFDPQGALRASVQVLHRPVPVLKYTLAYLPEGPVADWSVLDPTDITTPMLAHFKASRVFLVRMGPPVITRSWGTAAVRKALAAGGYSLVTELEPLQVDDRAAALAEQLRGLGWTKQEVSEDFTAGQPEFSGRIPLISADGQALDLDGVLAQMNQNSRRQARKAAAGPLEIQVGGIADIERFHALSQETAERDGFTGRPASYFTTMMKALNAHAPGTFTVYFAVHEGRDLAAAIRVRTGQGAWYTYGASSSAERKLYAPKALIHRMITDSLAEGCTFLDLGGVSATLDNEHHLAGLTQFKTTLGCDVVQTLGEWDYPLNKAVAAAFNLYMRLRDRG
ncbi:MAG: aminoacyltransferase [Micrococcaceae bacterium]|uniref:lipid II:glycine glycyltransferase FemX n=1 Tax=unclassified Arthrobacter TaxID=235627 RepID=UPI00264F6157|nr:aminoacyltransferase [Micrococcaceae bacterium]MDN5812661.1 aminoacyltransferase [Micrococcaceae bacterium]MDN5823001.1 aminoacyltransferase [Micrococcaceae bacterium]MDN5886215.1 aminoacyltransferase [Micrococcaceae bacterium]MDN5904102.1 aminoacyltransferase [Micrococcaceae bacterium]